MINSNDSDYCTEKLSHFSNLVDLLHRKASDFPNRKIYTFLQDGEIEKDSLDYKNIDQRSRAIAAKLQCLATVGDRALLLYSPGLEFITAFLGCLYAKILAVPVYPPRRNRNLLRLQAIIADSQANIVLTTESLLDDLQGRLSKEQESESLIYLATDSVPDSIASNWQKPEINSDTLAFLQYTSGSTGKPKGVMVSHGNLMHNSKCIRLSSQLDSNSVSVTWLPNFHDMGLMDGVIQPLYSGFLSVSMSPSAFVRKPVRWLKAISKYRANHSGGPNFGYQLCVDKIDRSTLENIDLSCWRHAYSGAEPVQEKTLIKFAEAFKDYGFNSSSFYPSYGMAETTLMISGGQVEEEIVVCRVKTDSLRHNRITSVSSKEEDYTSIVSCGQPWLNMKVIIVDHKLLTLSKPNCVGEIWVSGSSVTQGYWQRPEQTQETYQAYLKDSEEGPWLRTGDLGFLRDGELYITGRLKDVIIVRGRNYYPQDIELTAQTSHHALKADSSAAFTVKIDEDERLVVAQEVKRSYLRKLDLQAVVNNIRSAISQQYGLEVYAILILRPFSIPKTSSGKIQRNACRLGFIENSLDVLYSKFLTSKSSVPTLSKVSLSSVKNNLDKTSEDTSKGNQQSNDSQNKADKLVKWLQSYANERINSRLIDERRCIPPHIVLDLGNQGLLGMQIPSEYGGINLNNSDTLHIVEQLGAIDQTLALMVSLNNILGIRPIMKYASKAVKNELLFNLAKGRELAAFALTEPEAGSNPRSMKANALPNGDDKWLLQGTKIWSGSAAWAGVINVFARQLDHNGKILGISGFVVRQGEQGLRQGPEALTMGMRGMVQNAIYLEDVPVKAEQLLGKPTFGMEVAQDSMMYGRLGIGAVSVGGMKRCAQLMLRYASRRSISTGLLLHNPITQIRLSNITSAITALESLVGQITKLLDIGITVPVEAYTACKTSGPEFYWQAADSLVQLLGGRGYIETNIAPQILRDARVLRIFEGPTETLNMFLGARILKKSSDLDYFLRETLEAPNIAQSLEQAVEKIEYRQHQLKNVFTDAHISQWLYVRIGEVGTWAILLAAVQRNLNHSNKSKPLQDSFDWIQANFENTLHQIQSGTSGDFIQSDINVIQSQISDYQQSIGDIEQTLAGEDYQMDSLLQSKHTLQNFDLKPQKPSIVFQDVDSKNQHDNLISSQVDLKYSVKSIQDWLLSWLEKKLKIERKTVDINQSFSDHGLDSVMMLELIQDLSEWLDKPLEETLLWNFPTMKSLSQHLVEEMNITMPISSLNTKLVFDNGQKSEIDKSIKSDDVEVDDLVDHQLNQLEKVINRLKT